MKLGLLNNRKGMTLIELSVAVGLLSMVLVITMTLLTTMLNIWKFGAQGTSDNMNASLAMRHLVLEAEEGESASVDNNDTRLTVKYPYYDTSTGDYTKGKPGKTVVYYLSGATGSESTGTLLWKSCAGVKTRLGQSVEELSFTGTTSSLVRVMVKYPDDKSIRPNRIRMSIKLRNG